MEDERNRIALLQLNMYSVHGTISVPSILLCDNSRIKGFERDSCHVVTFRTVTLPITYCTRLSGLVEQRSDALNKIELRS